MNQLRGPLSVLGLIVAIWLVYLFVEIAKHVQAWPFN